MVRLIEYYRLLNWRKLKKDEGFERGGEMIEYLILLGMIWVVLALFELRKRIEDIEKNQFDWDDVNDVAFLTKRLKEFKSGKFKGVEK